jgi:hypothetical protein
VDPRREPKFVPVSAPVLSACIVKALLGLEQQAIANDLEACSFLELDGTGTVDAENLMSEAAMGGFWEYYREIMGL